MSHPIKNIEHSTVLPLAEQVTYQPGQIVSKTLAQNKHHNVTLFAFDKNEEISAHDSSGDAMVTVLDGTGSITIGDSCWGLYRYARQNSPRRLRT